MTNWFSSCIACGRNDGQHNSWCWIANLPQYQYPQYPTWATAATPDPRPLFRAHLEGQLASWLGERKN